MNQGEKKTTAHPDSENDPVSPGHYKSHPSGVEAIDITEHFNFCIGNVIKYLWRAGLKHNKDTDSVVASELQDCKKAAWYLKRHIERLEGKLKHAHQFSPSSSPGSTGYLPPQRAPETAPINDSIVLSATEADLIRHFRSLPDDGRIHKYRLVRD